ncbi:MAG TPA: hypothetical protein VFX03_04860, partial [Thermomicrobiales bacterium]|nr:hypothetical protein [Thermomicrobiales bacterium]
PKVAIPSPTMVHFRGGRSGIDIQAYPELDEFFADLTVVYRQELESLYRAGCRYIQLDDTNLAYLCDPNLRAQAQARGDDPDALPRMIGLSAVFMLLTFVIFVAYGLAAAAIRRHVIARPRVLTWMRRVFAGALVGLGAKLALAHR